MIGRPVRLSAGGVAGTLGFAFRWACPWAAYNVTAGLPANVPRQAVEAASLAGTWLGNWFSVISTLFHGSKPHRAHPYRRGGDPDPTSSREESRRIWGHL